MKMMNIFQIIQFRKVKVSMLLSEHVNYQLEEISDHMWAKSLLRCSMNQTGSWLCLWSIILIVNLHPDCGNLGMHTTRGTWFSKSIKQAIHTHLLSPLCCGYAVSGRLELLHLWLSCNDWLQPESWEIHPSPTLALLFFYLWVSLVCFLEYLFSFTFVWECQQHWLLLPSSISLKYSWLL
jgi:hypothetical protein